MKRLYVVRHGNTFESGEAPRRIGYRTDLPLTVAGREQADALGRPFRSNVEFSRAFSSNLLRTRETAQAILMRQSDPLALEHAEFLNEIDHGPDEDRPEGEVLERVGRSALDLWDTALIPPAGWDAGADWRIPAWRAFAAEIDQAQGDAAILLVTSNGAARFALSAFGLNSGDKSKAAKLRTGSYGLIEIDGGRFRLKVWDKRPE